MRNYEEDNKRRLLDLDRIVAFNPPTKKVYYSKHIFAYQDFAGRNYGYYVEDNSLPETMFGKRASRHQTLEEAQAKEREIYNGKADAVCEDEIL